MKIFERLETDETFVPAASLFQVVAADAGGIVLLVRAFVDSETFPETTASVEADRSSVAADRSSVEADRSSVEADRSSVAAQNRLTFAVKQHRRTRS